LSCLFKKILAGLVLFSLSGCTGTYNSRMQLVKRDIKAEDYPGAASNLKKSGLGKQEKNRLLYHLEAGLLYHLAGNYEKSNYFLERAEWISDEMYSKSLTGEAASFVTSDNIIPYRGEYHDYLFTNYYKLLNYLYLGSLDDALVEARRINHKLSLFKQDDAFIRYLTAILYHYNRQYSDAFIEYKKAYEVYKDIYRKKYGMPVPRQLAKDISVFCRESGFSRCREFPHEIRNVYSPPEEYGTVVFLIETDFVPHKIEKRIEAAIPQEYRKKYPAHFSDVYYLTVALPEYTAPENPLTEVSINLNGTHINAECVEDVGRIVYENFKDEEGGILIKTIGRAVMKYVAYKSVKGKSGGDEDGSILRKVLGTTVNIIGAATEQADTRAWLTVKIKIIQRR